MSAFLFYLPASSSSLQSATLLSPPFLRHQTVGRPIYFSQFNKRKLELSRSPVLFYCRCESRRSFLAGTEKAPGSVHPLFTFLVLFYIMSKYVWLTVKQHNFHKPHIVQSLVIIPRKPFSYACRSGKENMKGKTQMQNNLSTPLLRSNRMCEYSNHSLEALGWSHF